jgi:hypothetical protein
VEAVLGVHVKGVKIKKFLDSNVVTMHVLQKGFMKEYFCCSAHVQPFVSYKTMVDRMVGSTSSANNMHGVVDDNSNPYSTMVMDAMRMNQCYADVTRFFDLFKDFDEPLFDGCINHRKLLPVTQVFTIKLDYGLSEAGYNRIVK